VRWLRRILGSEDEPTREDDPRGGLQSDEYRHADPREVVQEGSTAMAGPAGAPQEGLSVDERREQDRKTD
jgi:hypothetical protein